MNHKLSWYLSFGFISKNEFEKVKDRQFMTDMSYVVHGSKADVKKALLDLIATEVKPSYVRPVWEDDCLLLNIEKAGHSELRIRVRELEGGKIEIFEKKSDRRIAFMHKLFVPEIEKRFHNAMINKLGAQTHLV